MKALFKCESESKAYDIQIFSVAKKQQILFVLQTKKQMQKWMIKYHEKSLNIKYPLH